MKDILPPYGVILRDAIDTGDKGLMQAFVKYSDFVKSRGMDLTSEEQSSWDEAHKALVDAAG